MPHPHSFTRDRLTAAALGSSDGVRMVATILLTAATFLSMGCAPTSNRPSQATAPLSARTERARIIPRVDHHQHIVGPGMVSRRAESFSAVALPAGLDTLLRERGRLSGTVEAGALFTDDAQVVDIYSEGLPWVRGRTAVAEAVGSLPRERRFVANAFSVDGSVAHVAGEVLAPSLARPVADFSMGLKKDAQGRWRIATELLTSIREWEFEEPITADDLIANLDEAGIDRAVVLSVAYWPGGPEPTPPPGEYERVRAENDWTAAQVARHPGRLIAFCGISPLRDYAVTEVRRCARELGMKGIKMHFRSDKVDILDPRHVERLRQVFRAANEARMAIVVHSEPGGQYGRAHAEAFLSELLPAAPDVTVQISHLWGGNRYRPEPLAVYADAIAAGDLRTRNLYFDLTEVVAGAMGSAESLKEIAGWIRRIGLGRVLHGSDATTAGGASAAQRWAEFRHRIPLTDAELRDIADNVAPYLR